MSQTKTVLLYTDEASSGEGGLLCHGLVLALLAAGWRVAMVQPAGDSAFAVQQRELGITHSFLSFDPVTQFASSLTEMAEPRKILGQAKPDLVCFCDAFPFSNVAAKHVAISQKIPHVVLTLRAAAEHAQRFPACLPVVRQQLGLARECLSLSEAGLSALRTHFGLPHDKGLFLGIGAPGASLGPSGEWPASAAQVVLSVLEQSRQSKGTVSHAEQPREAFVLRPTAGNPDWPAAVLAYVRLFLAGAPVSLVIATDATQTGALASGVIQQTVMAVIRESGKASFADVVLTRSPEELRSTLTRFSQVHELPFSAEANPSQSPAHTVFRAALLGSLAPKVPAGKPPGKRLLTILDYAIQPYSIGDFLFYLMGSMMAAEKAGIDKVDLIILSDLSRGHADPVMRGWVKTQNQHARLMSIFPLVEFHPRFGSLLVFDSAAEFNAHLSKVGRNYELWPSAAELQEMKYMSYDVLIAVKAYHERHGVIPQFKFSPRFATWASDFFSRHAEGFIPVTVNLRNNPSFGGHRNYVLPAWRDFFARCQASVPVKFIVTCAASEVDPSLRHLPNVVFAKDHHTTLLDDLVLIRYAAFHIGCCSGPAALVMFLDNPYHIFNNDMLPHLPKWKGSLLLDDNGELLCSFRKPLQTLGVIPETAEGIWQQFEKIWSSRDWRQAWASRQQG